VFGEKKGEERKSEEGKWEIAGVNFVVDVGAGEVVIEFLPVFVEFLFPNSPNAGNHRLVERAWRVEVFGLNSVVCAEERFDEERVDGENVDVVRKNELGEKELEK
jgi:hypothetical protein